MLKFKHTLKTLNFQTRNYDRKRYLKEKRKEAKLSSLENIKLSDCFDLLNKYTLGINQEITAQFELQPLDKPLRTVVQLPIKLKGLQQKNEKILVFAEGEDQKLAKELGADFVGSDDLIQEIIEGKVEFDRALSTKQVFPKVIKIARILGPKGLMPSPAKGKFLPS
jgi:large subunit ribosomal protein L1